MNVDELLKELKSDDEIKRREAALELGSVKSEKGIRGLIEAFGDESWLVRETAIESILRIGDESAMALFLSVLKDKDARIRNAAVKILTGLGNLAINALSKAIEDEDDNIVRYSADCLGDIGNSKGLKPLIDALERSKGKDSRYYIILALGKLGESAALEDLLPCLEEDLWIQTATLEALGNIGDKRAVSQILETMKKDIFLLAPACDALGKIGDVRAMPALLETLESDNEEVLAAAVRALVRIKDQNRSIEKGVFTFGHKDIVTKGIVTTLASDDPEARASAAVLLGWLKAEGSIQPLSKLLEDEDYEVSKKAGETLVQLGNASVDSLISLMDIPEKRAKLLAMKALEEIGDSRAVSYARKSLSDEDEDIRLAAVKLLGAVGNYEILMGLMPLLDDPSEIIRASTVSAIVSLKIGRHECQKLLSILERGSAAMKRSIAEVMGRLKMDGAKEALEKLFVDDDHTVKQAAVFALAEIEGKEGVGSIPTMLLGSEDPVLKKSAAIVIGKLKDSRGVQPLMLTALDSDPWVRYHSFQTLGILKDERAVKVVKDGVNDPFGAVRIAALRALLELSPSEINGKLISMSKESDEDVRQSFIEVLSAHGGAENKKVFIKALKDPSWKVREIALKALGRISDEESVKEIKKMLNDENLFVRETAKGILEERE